MAQHKCKYCKQGEERGSLLRQPKFYVKGDNKGKPYLDKNGTQQYEYYHQSCKEANEKAQKDRNDLYDFLKDAFFDGKIVPPYMLKKIQDYIVHYECRDIMGCLRSLADEINGIKVNDTNHKINLICYMLGNNIAEWLTNKIAESAVVDNHKPVVFLADGGRKDSVEDYEL